MTTREILIAPDSERLEATALACGSVLLPEPTSPEEPTAKLCWGTWPEASKCVGGNNCSPNHCVKKGIVPTQPEPHTLQDTATAVESRA